MPEEREYTKLFTQPNYSAIFRLQLLKPLLNSRYIGLIIAFFIFILMDTIVLCITYYIQEVKTPKVVEKLPHMLKVFHKRPDWVNKVTYVLKMFFPIYSYFALTLLVICTFSSFYLYISLMPEQVNSFVTTLSDSLYYSATTYFTVGFGDITPKTTQFKFISVVEMIVSNFLNVIFIPMIVAFFLGFLNKDKTNESNN